jgi:hypothetical protein
MLLPTAPHRAAVWFERELRGARLRWKPAEASRAKRSALRPEAGRRVAQKPTAAPPPQQRRSWSYR